MSDNVSDIIASLREGDEVEVTYEDHPPVRGVLYDDDVDLWIGGSVVRWGGGNDAPNSDITAVRVIKRADPEPQDEDAKVAEMEPSMARLLDAAIERNKRRYMDCGMPGFYACFDCGSLVRHGYLFGHDMLHDAAGYPANLAEETCVCGDRSLPGDHGTEMCIEPPDRQVCSECGTEIAPHDVGMLHLADNADPGHIGAIADDSGRPEGSES